MRHRAVGPIGRAKITCCLPDNNTKAMEVRSIQPYLNFRDAATWALPTLHSEVHDGLRSL